MTPTVPCPPRPLRIVSELGLALGLFAIGAGAFISIFCLEALIWVSDTTRQTGEARVTSWASHAGLHQWQS